MSETIDLQDLNPGAWFPFGNGGQVCVRTCAADDLDAISKQCEKEKIEYKLNERTRQMERIKYSDVNEERRKRLYWDYIIVDWKGLVDKDGNDIPCTSEMKATLMGKSTKFAKFILDCLEKLVADEEKIAEEEQKN